MTEKLTEVEPAGTVTDVGELSDLSGCDTVIVVPDAEAGAVRVTTQVAVAWVVSVVGAQVKPESPGAPASVKPTEDTTPFRVAVTVAD